MNARTTSYLAALGYLFVLVVAEIVTNFVVPPIGLGLYGALLVIMLLHAALAQEKPIRALTLSLALVPLAKLISYAFSPDVIPPAYLYMDVGLPMLVAVALGVNALGISWQEIGIRIRGLPVQLLVALSGILFGVVQYAIVAAPRASDPLGTGQLMFTGFAIVFSTGFVEELIFRGMIQWATSAMLGQAGMVYTAALYALLHVGYQSWQLMVFVFAAGLFFGWVVMKTRNILGVSLAHGLLNALVYLVLPTIVG